MDDYIVDKAGKALEGITDLIDKATQTLPDDKLLLFLEEVNKSLQSINEMIQKITDSQETKH